MRDRNRLLFIRPLRRGTIRKIERTGTLVPGTRERQIRENLGLINSIAGRLQSATAGTVDAEALTDAGLRGLIEACSGFDPDRNVAFGSFARNHIRGAMLDHLRNQA